MRLLPSVPNLQQLDLANALVGEAYVHGGPCWRLYWLLLLLLTTSFLGPPRLLPLCLLLDGGLAPRCGSWRRGWVALPQLSLRCRQEKPLGAGSHPAQKVRSTSQQFKIL